MLTAQVPILGFAAASGTGKTTLLCQLIPILKNNGVRIGIIKHSHHDFDMDQPGKDSYQLRKAGALTVMLVSPYRRATITEFTEPRQPKLADQIAAFDQTNLDLLLVEGFKHEAFPKIELHRAVLQQPVLYPNDPNIVAIASDIPMDAPGYLIQLDINQPEIIANFIQHQFMNP